MTIHVDARAVHRVANDEEAIALAHKLARNFATEASLRDRERRLPVAEVEEYSRSGLWAMTVPKQFGGAGVSVPTLARVIVLISAADPSIGQISQNHFAILERLRLHAHPEQQTFFFGRVLAGDRFGNAVAEAGGKSPKDHQTRLHQTPEGLRLHGHKVYATGALFSHWVPVSAIDDDGETVTVFVPRDAKGLQIVDDWSGFGQTTTASGSVLLNDVRVEPLYVFRNRLTRPPVDTTNAVSQIVHAAIDLGIAKAALEDTQRFLRKLSHPARGSGVAHATEDAIAIRDVGELIVRYSAADAILERAADFTERARQDASEAAAAKALMAVVEAKILTTEVSLLVTNKLFELAGTQSTLAEHNLDRHWRNARTHTLHDGVRWKYHAIGQFHLNGLLCDTWTLGHPYTAFHK